MAAVKYEKATPHQRLWNQFFCWNHLKQDQKPLLFYHIYAKVSLLAAKLFDIKEVLEIEDCWAAPWYFVSQRELLSRHKLHIQNFTHKASWVQLTHTFHYTSPNFTRCSGFYISRLTQWHRLYIQFPRRSLERSWHKLQTLYFSTAPQRKCSRF